MNTWSLFPPGNDLADSLVKVKASLDPSKISMSLSTLISQYRLSLYTSWRRSIQSGLFQHQIPPVSSEELTLPRSARCALSRLRCNGHSTLLGTYLHRVGEPRLLHVATVVLNHRTFPISCWTALYSTICVAPYSATPSPF